MLSNTNPLYVKGDLLAKDVYRLTLAFPKHELYGLTSQLRRAALSVILNCVEGFARRTEGELRNFLFIAFGSIKEVQYLISFAKEQQYLQEGDFLKIMQLSDETARILWTIIKKINN